MTYDYAVIGAGVFGAWIARALMKAGQRVILVDQYGPAHNRASSGGETRIHRMGYGSRELYTAWAWRSRTLYQDFYAAHDPTLFTPCGFLWMARETDEFLSATAEVLARRDIPFETLQRPELERRWPQIDFGPCTWALHETAAGALLARRGVQTVVRASVAECLTYGQMAIAPPPVQSISAGTYIYACGPWLRKLFPELLGDKLLVARQEVFYFGVPPGDSAFSPPALPAWIDPGSFMYGLPDLESRGFKIAPDRHGPPIDPDTEERHVSSASVESVRAYLRQRFPRLANAPLTQTEVCQYENTANGDFIIDRHPEQENVWIVGGGSGHGYKHGPALGEYVAAALLEGAVVDPRFSLAAQPALGSTGRLSTIPSER